MHRLALLLAPALLLLGAPAGAARAQLLADTTVAWQSYHRDGTTRARLYATPEGERRERVVVLTELAANRGGPSTVRELRHVAELIGRRFGFDPASAYFVVHWGAHSYEGAAADDRDLLLRASFNRTSTGNLSSPNWYLLSRDQLRELTDRQFSD